MPSDTTPLRSRPRRNALHAIRIALRGVATATVLVAAYFLAPVRAKTPTQDVLWLAAALAAFAAIIALQARSIVNSRHPQWRAVESMTVAIPLFLIVFARIYLTMSVVTDHAFSVSLDRAEALYFTITVFSTVGFGDISPQTDFTRLVVSVQMLLDLAVLGAIVRVLFGAAERAVAGRANKQSDSEGSAPQE